MRQAGYNLDSVLKKLNQTGVPDMVQFRKALSELREATKLVADTYASGAD